MISARERRLEQRAARGARRARRDARWLRVDASDVLRHVLDFRDRGHSSILVVWPASAPPLPIRGFLEAFGAAVIREGARVPFRLDMRFVDGQWRRVRVVHFSAVVVAYGACRRLGWLRSLARRMGARALVCRHSHMAVVVDRAGRV